MSDQAVASRAERLLSPWLLVLFALGVAVVLILLFPQQRIIDQVTHAKHVTTVGVFFLENLLRTAQKDEPLRLLLAKKQLELGNIPAVQNVLQPLLASRHSDVQVEAEFLNLRLAEIQAVALPVGSHRRAVSLEHIGQLIRVLLGKTTDQKLLASLADSAMLGGHGTLAQHIYERLGHQKGAEATRWYQKAATLALANGEYRQTARIYFAAQEHAKSHEKQRRFFLAALKALQAGNLLSEAIRQAKRHVGSLVDDEPTLLFLVALGRSAGDGSFSQKYVNVLLHLSPKRLTLRRDTLVHPAFVSLVSWKGQHDGFRVMNPFLLGHDVATFRRRGERVVMTHSQANPLRPFDDRIYRLGYDVFLENHNLADAYMLAERAVQQVPGNLSWRKRLAQIAEWTGRPSVALAQWRYLAGRQADPDAYHHILQLAPGLFDDESVIFALRGIEKRGRLTAKQRQRLVASYERIGQPGRAIAYLNRLYQKRADPALLDQAAGIYQRMGKGARSLRLYHQLDRTYGPDIPRAMRQAEFFVEKGQLHRAYQRLLEVKGQADPSDESFWALFGELAWTLEIDDQAEQAYRLLWKEDHLNAKGNERLIVLLQREHPKEAVEIGLNSWKTSHDPKFFLMVLSIFMKQRQWNRAQAILEQLGPDEEALFSSHRRYWLIRAEVMEKVGHKKQALEAYRQALALDPFSSTIRASLLWFLVDQKQIKVLTSYVHAWAKDLLADPLLWSPAAAAYLLLGYPAQALPFFQRQLPTHQHDYLWLLNYADALEASADQSRAWHIRRYAWLTLRKAWVSQHSTDLSAPTIQAYLQLASTQAPGDPFLRFVRSEVKGYSTPVTKELILSWLISRKQFDAARFWLWKQYARSVTQPAWASLAMALAHNDWDAIDALIQQEGRHLSASDAVEAAKHLRRFPRAQDKAFQLLGTHPFNQSLFQSFQESTFNHVSSLNSTLKFLRRLPLVAQETKTSLPLEWGRIRLEPEIRMKWQRSDSRSDLVGVPRVDRSIGGSIQYDLPQGSVKFTGAHRKALSAFTEFKLDYTSVLNSHFTTILEYGRNQEANDSVFLLVGGMKDRFKIQSVATIAKHQVLSLQVSPSWFYSQKRERLGKGLSFEGVFTQEIRTEYPDLSVEFSGMAQQYSRKTLLPARFSRIIPQNLGLSGNLVIPKSFQQSGVTLRLGDSMRHRFSRGFKPFGLAGGNYNSVLGFGFVVEGGLGTTLWGHDRLAFIGSHLRGGFGQNATLTNFTLQYQLWF